MSPHCTSCLRCFSNEGQTPPSAVGPVKSPLWLHYLVLPAASPCSAKQTPSIYLSACLFRPVTVWVTVSSSPQRELRRSEQLDIKTREGQRKDGMDFAACCLASHLRTMELRRESEILWAFPRRLCHINRKQRSKGKIAWPLSSLLGSTQLSF